MATKKTNASKKRTNATTVETVLDTPSSHVTTWQNIRSWMKDLKEKITHRVAGLQLRRPHRSFKRTMPRDYKRPLTLPGYWAFTLYVRRTIWGYKKLFGLLALVFGLLTVGLVGIASQDLYIQLGDTLRETSGEVFKGNWGEIGKASLLLVSGVTGLSNQEMTVPQQICGIIVLLFTWLTTVYLLRGIIAGRKLKLRDGLYNAGSPVIATFLVLVLLLLQLVPIALAIVGYGVASGTGLLDNGIEGMVFWACAGLLGVLSLYWITSTFMALVIVTLPGMYPMQAIRAAGDLVIGRRVRILLRVLWLILIVAVTWFIVMVPIILLDAWLKGAWPAIEWLPIVPVGLLVMGTLTIIWAASYVYLLYRKVVDDDSAPA